MVDSGPVVLLVEEVTESPYRIDRALTHLRQAGALDRVVAAVVGDLMRCEGPQEHPSALEVIGERLGSLGIPVLAGVPMQLRFDPDHTNWVYAPLSLALLPAQQLSPGECDTFADIDDTLRACPVRLARFIAPSLATTDRDRHPAGDDDKARLDSLYCRDQGCQRQSGARIDPPHRLRIRFLPIVGQ